MKLDEAIKNKNYDEIVQCIKNGEEVKNIFILKDMAAKKNKKLLKTLSDCGFNLMLNGGILLLDACLNRQEDNLKIILSQAPNDFEKMPILIGNYIKNFEKNLTEEKTKNCLALLLSNMQTLKLPDWLKISEENKIFVEQLFIEQKITITNQDKNKKIIKI